MENMTGQREKNAGFLRDCEARESGKIEYLPALIIFGMLGAVFLRGVQIMDEKQVLKRRKKPKALDVKDIDPFKWGGLEEEKK